MKNVVIDMSQITDSRELMESKPLPFIQIFIYLIVGIILIAFSWCYFGEIDIVVKGNGIVRPNNGVNTISTNVGGYLVNSNLINGQEVKAGEILVELDSSELSLRRDALVNELEIDTIELKNMELFKQSMIDNKNYFDSGIESQNNYYYKYVKYLNEMDITRNQVEVIYSKISKANREIDSLKKLERSINDNQCFVSKDDSKYYLMYNNYSHEISSYNDKLKTSTDNLKNSEILYKSQGLSESALEDIRSSHKLLTLEYENYITKAILDITTNIESNSIDLDSYYSELKNISSVASSNQDIEKIMDSVRTQYIVNINDNIKAMDDKIAKAKIELKAMDYQVDACKIYAPVDGFINVTRKYNNGDLIIAGVDIATIIPADSSSNSIQVFIPNKDISNIKIGDKIKYEFIALPKQDYGEFEGVITNISMDATIKEGSTNGHYIIESSLLAHPVSQLKDNEPNIKVGMLCEAYIITNQEKLLSFLLRKIDLLD